MAPLFWFVMPVISYNDQPIPTPSLPVPIPFSSLPAVYKTATRPQSANTIAQILNTLSLYPLAVDGKAFSTLSLVFTDNVVANYSAPIGVVSGLSNISAVIESSLAPVDTQHSYGTQVLEILGNDRARSLSYFAASHFGRGSYYGEVLYSHGQYQDTWIRGSDDEWRIDTRNLVYMGPLVGNTSIFTPQR
ncbi:hypothetical protein N7G274_010522 [Stereocaulon virgatum]|uniref:SnoaL-like domain-containing protein n=1 Tax=Stereocaulon virgatum TaxID=373712 RepID=A0ABR3ZTC8_9LECA